MMTVSRNNKWPVVETLNCDDGADRGYFQSPTAWSNRIGAEASVTRADVLSYRGNGWTAVPNKTRRASLSSRPSGFYLDLHASILTNGKERIALDFLTVLRFRLSGSSLMSMAQCGP